MTGEIMNRIQNIVVPIDFSAGSEYAMAFAQKVALRSGGTVSLLHVIPAFDGMGLHLNPDMQRELTQKLKEKADERLQQGLGNFDEEIRGKAVVLTGSNPSKEILNYLQHEDQSVDLVVAGSRGNHQTKMRRGGTTVQLIRNARVPVLSVDENVLSRNIRKIVMPTDGSRLSMSGLVIAIEISQLFSAEITLLFVEEQHESLTGGVTLSRAKDRKGSRHEEIINRVERYLGETLSGKVELTRGVKPGEAVVSSPATDAWCVPLKVVVRSGVAADQEIVHYLQHHGDLAVMVTHGHSGFAHLFLGSTTEKVIQQTDQPVITIKPKPSEFEKAKSDDYGRVLWNPV
jgi:nucleotide-binding universal stress UspA family protein